MNLNKIIKKMNGKKLIFISLIIMCLFFNISGVKSIGVSPNKIFFESIPGGYAEQNFLISDTEPSKYIIKIEGEHPEWFSIEKSTENKTSQNLVKLKVNIPKDAAITNYKTNLVIYKNNSEDKIKTKNTNNINTNNFNTNKIKTNNINTNKLIANSNAFNIFLNLPIELNISGDIKIDCVAGGLRIPDFEEGENFYSEITIKNNGNSRIKPKGSIIISNEFNEEIYFGTFTGQEILPTTTSKNFIEKNINLKAGNYLLKIYIDECKQELTKKFKVLEKGSITKRGELISLESSDKELKKNSLIPIKAKFKNIGDRPVNAKFSGVIEKENKIVKVIDTEPIMVEAGKTINLESFFNPIEEGTYTLKGKIVYDDKQSSEIEKKFVIKKDKNSLEITIATTTLIIFIIIILLMIKIIDKKKRKIKRKIKRKNLERFKSK